MDDLIEFLRAQLDEDERVALAAPRYNWTIHLAGDPETGEHTEQRVLDHVIRHDPDRVLLEVEAKRRILDEYDAALANLKRHPDDLAGKGWLLATIRVMKLLALPAAARPGYRPEWAPRWHVTRRDVDPA